mmetsp:Transcript_11046/g.50184  ORF Transcript_11046/g.50184 Transcript_11046/m.50184 type:complete len:225 (+) Transcript_11046:966-1640(+)
MRPGGEHAGRGAARERGREGHPAAHGQPQRVAPVRSGPTRGAAQAAERDFPQVFPREAAGAVEPPECQFRAPGVSGRHRRFRPRRRRADGARPGLRVAHAGAKSRRGRRGARRVRAHALRRARRRQVPRPGLNREDAREEGRTVAARARAAVDEPAQRRVRRAVRRPRRRDAPDGAQVSPGRHTPVRGVGGVDDACRDGERRVRRRGVEGARSLPRVPGAQTAG